MASSSDSISSGRKFLKQNWQIIYALILIILIPVTIAANTLFVVSRFRTTVDVELQRTALIIGRLFNVTSLDLFDNPVALQQRVEEVADVIPEIKSLDILAIDGVDFFVVASLDPDSVGRQAQGQQHILSWSADEAIAYLTKSPRSTASEQNLTPEEVRGSERYWGVVMPLHDASGERRYLLSSKISLNVIDELVRSNLFWSYAWLAITMLIVVLILGSNTRLFQYTVLFKRLKEVDKMKDDFISMASHELRAPITAIKGYLSLFLDNAFGPIEGKSREVMQTTFSISLHLGGLVEDLLDVSRIEQGRMKFDLEVVSVEDIIEEVVKQMHFEAEKKALKMEYRRPEQPLPKLNIDVSRFKQTLINLVSNAIKYTPSGEVTLTSIVDENGLMEVKVTDTGLGMSAEQREKLFSKFYRVRTDDTATIPGTGLGLWITKKIVEQMGGKIYVDSIEKVGTQVSMTFPLAKGESSQPVAEEQSPDTKPNKKPEPPKNGTTKSNKPKDT